MAYRKRAKAVSKVRGHVHKARRAAKTPITPEQDRNHLPASERPVEKAEIAEFRRKLSQTYEMPEEEHRITPDVMFALMKDPRTESKTRVAAAKALISMRQLTVAQAKLLMGLSPNEDTLKFVDMPALGLDEG